MTTLNGDRFGTFFVFNGVRTASIIFVIGTDGIHSNDNYRRRQNTVLNENPPYYARGIFDLSDVNHRGERTPATLFASQLLSKLIVNTVDIPRTVDDNRVPAIYSKHNFVIADGNGRRVI